MGILKKTEDTLGKAGHGVLKAGEKVVGAVDITCDQCKHLMKPGILGEKRTVDGKDYQFCSVECADKFVEEH